MRLGTKWIIILMLITLSPLTLYAQNKTTHWILIENKTLNDVIHKEQGEIISFQEFFAGTPYIVTYVKSKEGIYRVIDILADNPKKGARIKKTLCFKLTE